MPVPEASTPLPFGPRDPRFEAKFVEWNVEYRFEPDFPIDQIRVATWAQVRTPEHIGNEDQVEEYRQHMANGAVFPPIVIMGPETLIDGNTRLLANKRLKKKTIPAYIVNVATVMLAKSLAATLNQMGGKRLSVEEAADAAKVMMDMDFADEAIAREIGRSVEQVRRIRSQIEFGERTDRLKLANKAQAVTQDNRVRLNSIKHDPPFAALVELVADVAPPRKTLTDLLKQVNDAPSDTDAITVIQQARAELKPAGPPPHRATVKPELRQASMHLGGLVKLAADPAVIFDAREDGYDERTAQWEKLADLANAMVQLYRAQRVEPAAA